MIGYFSERPLFHKIILLMLLIAGMGVRLLDLTDPPLDIHPTRQLHSALMARGMYYSQQVQDAPDWMIRTAIQQGKREAVIEPPILERLTAWGYQLTGGENLWIARLISALFWVAAGLALYSLTSSLVNPDGGLFSLGVYLFSSYAVQASRTFQPDPMMVSLIIVSWWAFYRWREKRTIQTAVLAGVVTGLTLLVKNTSIFFLFFPYLFLVLEEDLKKAIRSKQTWWVVALSVLPVLSYTLYGTFVAKFLSQQFGFRFFPSLWFELANYSRWFKQVIDTVGLPGLLLALAGIPLFMAGKPLRLILGAWMGYILYGLTFAYHIGTHDYYQLPFLPLAAISMAPIGAAILSRLAEAVREKRWDIPVNILLVMIILASFWSGRLLLLNEDYRSEPSFWRNLGDRLRESSVLGITQDYGYRMSYYGWDTIENWPSTGDLAIRDLAGKDKGDVISLLEKQIADEEYFLVTWFEEFDRQPEVKDYLYDHFPVEQGDGYMLFNLLEPLPSGN